MKRCRILAIVARRLPFIPRSGQRWLAHAARCPRCSAAIADRDQARQFVVRSDNMGVAETGAMWARVRTRIAADAGAAAATARPRTAGPLRRVRFIRVRPALIAAAGLVVAVGLYLAVRGPTPASEGGADIGIESLQAGGGAATPIIIRPRGSTVTIVWAAETVE